MKPEISLGVALAVSTAVLAVHSVATPTMSDVRTLDPGNEDISRSENAATWMSAGLVSVVSLVARDPMIFIIGGAVTIGVAWMNRHANHVVPQLGMFTNPLAAGSANSPAPVTEPMPLESYSMFEDQFSR